MKIAVIGAHGKSGKLICAEARQRGHHVTGFVRRDEPVEAQERIVKDAMDLEPSDLSGFDVVVDALGFVTPETLPLHSESLMRIADCLKDTDTRLLVVGGAGSLVVDDNGTTLAQTPDFPEAIRPLAKAMAKGLAQLRERNDVKWTYLSPAAEYRPDGERPDHYAFAGERLPANSKGESYLSYADMAQAMLDVAEGDKYEQERISVYTK